VVGHDSVHLFVLAGCAVTSPDYPSERPIRQKRRTALRLNQIAPPPDPCHSDEIHVLTFLRMQVCGQGSLPIFLQLPNLALRLHLVAGCTERCFNDDKLGGFLLANLILSGFPTNGSVARPLHRPGAATNRIGPRDFAVIRLPRDNVP
jgi:hypothetical protein